VRGTATLNIVTSYPVQKRFDSLNWLVEPMFGVALSPDLDENEFEIPNEDSLDIMIDTSNLFSDNRFAGIDRQEDGARISYGVKNGFYRDDGHYGTIFLGQSRRFDNAAYYPEGSGLEDKASAYVGHISMGLARGLQADYRFQLDEENFAPQRHEFAGASVFGPVTVQGRYLYLNGIEGTDFTETSEQVEVGGEYRFTPIWRAYGSALHDLGEEPGLRRAGLGLGYADECFSFALEAVRNLTNDAAGDSETVITARIGFKNIGEFSGPDISLRTQREENN
jgi:LPS-assembly protein